jgi:hypothetical protein
MLISEIIKRNLKTIVLASTVYTETQKQTIRALNANLDEIEYPEEARQARLVQDSKDLILFVRFFSTQLANI